uniref:Uncharacterized protein n=1 Tax=Strigamia maritima TaxID=126957 RepID=T1JIM4_STRMM
LKRNPFDSDDENRNLFSFKFVLKVYNRINLEERVSGHSASLGPITSVVGSSSTSSFTNVPRLSHTPTTADFQPPYFPPPYNHLPPQQQLDFHAHHVNTDPYLNSLHPASQQHYHQLHAPQRHDVLARRDSDAAAALHLQTNMHAGLPGYDSATRRSDYSAVRRPDVLMHHHGLGDQDSLILHNANLPTLEDGQMAKI